MYKKYVAGSVQLCAAQISGTEADVHAVHNFFPERKNWSPPAIVNASNAFNSLNLQTALHNIQSLCLSLATTHINQYLQGSFRVVRRQWCRKEPLRETRQPCQCMP